ncbi:hypothetical protein [Flavobacterium sp.]|jgi:hypothetical protein|uniref:pirin family protein n=1 Tax=Flavobacterium sp. TaxID=239 RepID=UPI0037833698
MIEQHPSKILKASFRNSVTANSYWSFSSLINKNPDSNCDSNFGSLKKFEEIAIKPNGNFIYRADKPQELILIPIIGAIDFFSDHQNGFVHSNQLQTINIEKGQSIEFKNPYEDGLISFLLIELDGITNRKIVEFNLSETNKLSTILYSNEWKISFGIFHSREEGTYKLASNKNGVFAFVVNGAFEFQNRLLEDRDALSIWDIKEIEFESLTQNSLILIIEVKINNNK